jgi:hypothetical protein
VILPWWSSALAAEVVVAGPEPVSIESWEELYDGMLLEAAGGDLDGAISRYEALVHNLSAEDPIRAEALFWLGQARYTLGDVEGAREALREGIRFASPARSRCKELLGQIELEESSIDHVPLEWTFDQDDHGFVHPSRYEDKGSLRIEVDGPDGDPALEWTTSVDVRKDDLLVVGFRQPTPPPRGVRFDVQSSTLDARLRILVFDAYGRKYTLGPSSAAVVAPAGRWVRVDVHLDAVQGVDPTQDPLVPALIDRMLIQDVTAYYGRASGQNTLFIDDFEVY